MSTYVSFKSAFVVTLVTFEEKTFLVSPQVSLKTKSEVTLVTFEEKNVSCESLGFSQN